jgi:hypothetical protein
MKKTKNWIENSYRSQKAAARRTRHMNVSTGKRLTAAGSCAPIAFLRESVSPW